MDTALRFGGRNALHAVTAGFKLETTVYAVAADLGDNLFVATVFAFVGAHDLHAPATRLGVAAVHAEQIPGKQCRFVTAGPGADFHERVAFVVRIFWQQKHLKLLLHLLRTRFRILQLFLRHLAHFRIVEHHLRGFDIFLNLSPVGKAFRNIT